MCTSHEALLLAYEEALTRQDSTTGALVRLLGPHALDRRAHARARRRPRRVPPRRRQPDRLQGRPDDDRRRADRTCARSLNPARIPGRLTLITRMGADKIEDGLRPLLRAVKDSGHPVVWACDPMHGNTYTSAERTQDPRLRVDRRRDRGLRPSPPRRGHLAGRHPRRAHRRGRHRVHRRRRQADRRRPRPPLRDGLRPAAQRPPVARPRVPHRRADPLRRSRLSRPMTALHLVTDVAGRPRRRRDRHDAGRRPRRRHRPAATGSPRSASRSPRGRS